jgi:hypothetical protein
VAGHRQPILILFFDLIAAFNISLLKIHRDPIVERRTALRREEQEAVERQPSDGSYHSATRHCLSAIVIHRLEAIQLVASMKDSVRKARRHVSSV